MKYAVFASGGKQYRVSVGDVVELEKLKVEANEVLTLDSVLLLVEDGVVKVGQPTLSEVVISAKVLGQIKAPKIRVAKFKAKARYRKVYGHRQDLTKVQIEKIEVKGKKTEEKVVKEVKKAKE